MAYTQEDADRLQANANRGMGAIARRNQSALLPLATEKFVHPEKYATKPKLNGTHFVLNVEPMGAPRMVRSDKWKNPRRPRVQRYFDFRDALRLQVTTQTGGELPQFPDEMVWRAFITMPESWSKKKKAEMAGKPHRAKPDRDNIDKAIGDALFTEDSGIWKGAQEKFWCKLGEARIELTLIYH